MEQNHERIKTINDHLRDHLSHIKLLIEEAFLQYNNNNNKSQKDFQSTSAYLDEVMLFEGTIDKFKLLIEELNDKITMGHHHCMMRKREDELINSKILLDKIIKENETLVRVNRRQNENLVHMENKYNNKNERRIIGEKIKNLKVEYKMIREYYKETLESIKIQTRRIEELNGQCDLIKDNIQRHRETNGSSGSGGGLDNMDRFSESGMKTLEEKIDSKEVYSKNEEEFYLGEIKKQKEKVNKVNKETEVIRIRIKQKEQEIRLSELKIKELTKLTRLLAMNQEKQSQMQFQQDQKSSGCIKTFDIKTRKLNLASQLHNAYNNTNNNCNEVILNSKNSYSFLKTKKNNGTNNNKLVISKFTRGLSAKNKGKSEHNEDPVEYKKNKVMIEIEELSKHINLTSSLLYHHIEMNIQKALNDNNYDYNMNIVIPTNRNKINIIQKENYTKDKDNNPVGRELSVNYDKVNYDYLDKSSYTIDPQRNDISIKRNNNYITKEEENTSDELINIKNKYNEDIIVHVKENQFNYIYPLTNSFGNGQAEHNEIEPQVKLFSKQDTKPQRRPFEISYFNKEEQVN